MTNTPVPVEAYLDTDFSAFDGDRELTVRIGEYSAAFDALLLRYGVTSGLFITGWNPRSQPQTAELNADANARMASLFSRMGLTALPHTGRSRDGTWSEEGFFVMGLNAEEGLTIAREFNQHGIVVFVVGERAELRLIPESTKSDRQ